MSIASITRQVVLLALFAVPVLGSASVFTEGEFKVNSMGAATYSIPVKIPPGINGVQPTLSLKYNSQSGNGLLGKGWGLSGLSSITRCPRTPAQDNGVHGAVRFDYDDRFCLDGMRLMVVGGSYGADGSEYRTEIESFSKVKALGASGNGPLWFEVRTKDGLIMRYGETLDSRYQAKGGPTIGSWALNKVTDRKGNSYSVTYGSNNSMLAMALDGKFLSPSYVDSPAGTFNEIYPVRIDYAGNEKLGVAYKNTIVFDYEKRPDPLLMYYFGSKVENLMRLSKIKVLTNGNLGRRYEVSYIQPEVYWNGRIPLSRIDQIVECDGNICKAPVKFVWEEPRWEVNTQSRSEITSPAILMDTKGDGRDQIVARTENTFFSYGDFNGDGKKDLFVERKIIEEHDGYNTTLWNYDIQLNLGDGAWRNIPVASNVDDYARAYCAIGDVNNDGISDLVMSSTGTTKVLLGSKSGQLSLAALPRMNALQLIDFDQDGNLDSFDGLKIYKGLGNGSFEANPFFRYPDPFERGSNWNPSNLYNVNRVYPGDVNGDGLSDLIAFDGLVSFQVAINHGDGTFDFGSIFKIGESSEEGVINVRDYNGDGKADILIINVRGPARMYIGDGRGGFYGDAITLPISSGPFQACVEENANHGPICVDHFFDANFGDVNGDGSISILSSAQDQPASVLLVQHSRPLIREIQNGGTTDARISITYAPSSKNPINKRGASSFGDTYAYLPYPNLWVVEKVHQDGRGDTEYQYGGLLTDLTSGRGMLGVAFVQEDHVQTGLVRVNEYNQIWPKTGTLSVAVTKGGSNLQTVSQESTNYTSLALGNDRYFVAPEQITTRKWELQSGVALPTEVRNYVYDCIASNTGCYGNIVSEVNKSSDGFTETITIPSYRNDAANWLIGLPLKRVVTKEAPDSASSVTPISSPVEPFYQSRIAIDSYNCSYGSGDIAYYFRRLVVLNKQIPEYSQWEWVSEDYLGCNEDDVFRPTPEVINPPLPTTPYYETYGIEDSTQSASDLLSKGRRIIYMRRLISPGLTPSGWEQNYVAYIPREQEAPWYWEESSISSLRKY